MQEENKKKSAKLIEDLIDGGVVFTGAFGKIQWVLIGVIAPVGIHYQKAYYNIINS